jgi:hypothetical protein
LLLIVSTASGIARSSARHVLAARRPIHWTGGTA